MKSNLKPKFNEVSMEYCLSSKYVMKRIFVIGFLLLLISCVTNPFTGRSQLMLVSDEEMNSLGKYYYQIALSESRVVSEFESGEVGAVKNVAKRIGEVADKLSEQYGIRKFEWECNVVAKEEPNAACFPGGKIIVHTGILPIAYDEGGLAAILGHEVAHALLKHSAEDISQKMLFQIGGSVLSSALKSKSPETQATVAKIFRYGATYGAILPFSREQETEADKLGLKLTAMAGYDPRSALEFWKRMNDFVQKSGKSRPPEFFSTHPSHKTRIQNIESWMNEMLSYYERSIKQPNRPLDSFKRSYPDRDNVTNIPKKREARVVSVIPTNSYFTNVKGTFEPAIVFKFKFNNDVLIEMIEIRGPWLIETTITTDAVALANLEKEIFVTSRNFNNKPLPKGQYSLKFYGKCSGKQFVTEIKYNLE